MTALDFAALAIFPRRNTRYTLQFLERILESYLFTFSVIKPIAARVLHESVQRWLMEQRIKFPPSVHHRISTVRSSVRNKPTFLNFGRASIQKIVKRTTNRGMAIRLQLASTAWLA